MGRKTRGGGGPSSTAGRAPNQALSLRDESTGKTRVDEASLLRVKHLQRLAAWAGTEAQMGPIGALLGRRLAATAEAAGVPLGAATFLCERCETVLKPGFNCTIRIKSKKNKKRRKKSNCCQNSVAYACHFCGDQNLIFGSVKGVVNSLLSSREKTNMDSTRRIMSGNNSNTRIQDIKEVLVRSKAASLQVNSTSRLRQSTSEIGEHGEKSESNRPGASKMEDGATSAMEFGRLAASNVGESGIEKLILENTNDEHMHDTEPISCKRIKIYESDIIPTAEFMVGSKFVTPQKNKMTEVTDYSREACKTSKMNKKGENSVSVSGHTLPSSSKSAQVPGSSRKRARKGWTTLKQIAEKDELERKEKMGNFVIPFFMP